jgi:hypothetical protein
MEFLVGTGSELQLGAALEKRIRVSNRWLTLRQTYEASARNPTVSGATLSVVTACVEERETGSGPSWCWDQHGGHDGQRNCRNFSDFSHDFPAGNDSNFILRELLG